MPSAATRYSSHLAAAMAMLVEYMPRILVKLTVMPTTKTYATGIV